MLPVALVMTSVILGLLIGGMTWISGDIRRAQSDRWRAVAADAAQTGLAMTLAWAKSTIDRTRTTPPEWEIADGKVINPLRSMFESPEFRGLTPPDLSAVPRIKANIGSRSFPAETGDVIAPAAEGEYVVGRYGDYTATICVRLQPFRLSEGAPRQYRIGVAGRVRVYDSQNADPGAFRGTRIVADRVLIATVGKQVLSRYARLVDIDLVSNWVPGERIEGPIHINRGYADADDALRDLVPMEMGRSLMLLRKAGSGGFRAPPGGPNFPVFADTVSMTVKYDGPRPDSADLKTLVRYGDDSLKVAAYPATEAREMFLSPDNQSQIQGADALKAGPRLVEDSVTMPPNSRARLPTVFGLAEGTDVKAKPWFRDLPDGVHILTKNDVHGEGGDRAAGGIYVRGTVEVLRMAVKGVYSYYFFQVGYVRDSWPRRTYVVRVNRETGAMRLVAHPKGVKVESLLAAPDAVPAGVRDESTLSAYGVTGPSETLVLRREYPEADDPGEPAFNGIIFVDWSKHDPMYNPGAPVQRALTGHILALGDPGDISATAGQRAWEKKRPFAGTEWSAFWPASMSQTPPEVICTEAANTTLTPPRATRLTIIAAGDIFIQNHLVVKGVAEACGLSGGTDRLRRENVLANASRDVLGIVSDKQILVGLGAPSSTDRAKSGLVLTGALAALGDPAIDRLTGTFEYPVPTSRFSAEGSRFRLRGSFSVEGLMAIYGANIGENYDVLWPAQATAPGTLTTFHGDDDCFPRRGATAPPITWPYNPFYGSGGVAGPCGTFASLVDASGSPNLEPRGKLTFFGSLVTKKRGVVGPGNMAFDKDDRYDQRLLTLAPPLFPNSVNLLVQVSTLEGLGLPPYTGSRADEAKFLSDPLTAGP